MEQQQHNKDSSFFLASVVKKGLETPMRTRFDTILKDRGLKWSDVYNSLGLSKAYASQIRNGILIPPTFLRIKISIALSCDTTLLWPIPEVVTADQIKKQTEEKNERI